MVELSRNIKCSDITIVGPREFAIDRLYETLCIVNQFTEMTESVVNNLSLTPNGQPTGTQLIDYADSWPWRITDITLPTTYSGYIYCLISVTCPEKRYVGFTRNIATRLEDHNSGYGSFGTAHNCFMPWALGAYICGLGQLKDSQLKSLEGKWQRMNELSMMTNRTGMEVVLENGRRVCTDWNEQVADVPSLTANFIVTVDRMFALELADQIDMGLPPDDTTNIESAEDDNDDDDDDDDDDREQSNLGDGYD